MTSQAGESEFEDRDLRRALLLLASNRTDVVDTDVLAELERRGYMTGSRDRPAVTPSGGDFLTAEQAIPPEQVRLFLTATRELLRVIPVGSEQLDREGARIVLTSVEVWHNEVTVHWTTIGVEPIADRRYPHLRLELARLSDDVGTDYQVMNSGGGDGSGYVSDCRARFSGVVPAEATELFFVPQHTNQVGPFTIDLTPG